MVPEAILEKLEPMHALKKTFFAWPKVSSKKLTFG